MKNKVCLTTLLVAAILSGNASAQYSGWTYSDSLFILTTPEGANIPASATETGFPLLVRLNKDFFTFSQAKAGGADVRFSTPSGTALPYQIEEWDATNGKALIWVRIPKITGNERQAIRMHWGNAGVSGETNGAAVFDTANGFCGVWHLNDVSAISDATIRQNTGTNKGTTSIDGIIGKAASFTSAANQYISLPTGSLAGITGTATFSLWTNGSPLLAKVQGSPFSAVNATSDELTSVWLPIPAAWSDGGVQVSWSFGDNIPRWSFDNMKGSIKISDALGQWRHWVFTHNSATGIMRIYLDGIEIQNQGSRTKTLGVPGTFNLGSISIRDCCAAGYDGFVDEFEVAKTERSATWNKLSYENQKQFQTLTGLLVPAGSTFSVPQTNITVLEGKTTTIAATAGGAQKTYWLLKSGPTETIFAVDRLNLPFSAYRVTKDTTIMMQFKAIYPNEIKTQDITVTIKEDLPEPAFTLTAPSTWNGRDPMEVIAKVTNQSAMDAKGVGALTRSWDVAGVAAAKTITPDKVSFSRSQGSGKMTVTLTIRNGGAPVAHSAVITVTEPATDAWVVRTPAANEKPVDNQFYARDDKDLCTVYYKGTITTSPDSVFLKVYAGTTLSKRLVQKPAGNAYSFEPTIDPKLTQYKFEFGSKTNGTETVLNTVTKVLCGDAYIIEGQSNAEGTNFTDADPNPNATSEYIRTYGSMGGDPGSGWYTATHKGTGAIGYWGLELARNFVTKYSMPICIINGAMGGTRIDLHQPNPANHYDISGPDAWANPYKLYGCLLTRVTGAKLTHGIRGVLWHQGENNSGAADPTGDWDYVHYQEYFVQMASSWKQDIPNIKHYYVFQVYPYPCAMGPKDDELRNEQRTLPYLFSNMSVMSTVGIIPAGRGSCHFECAAYQQFANLISPIVERDNYGLVPTTDITAPDIKKAYYTSSAKNEITLLFSQNMTWNAASTVNFYLDDVKGKVTGGSASGKTIKLALSGASAAKTLRYVRGADWNGQAANLLKGTNGIAALTFCNVPIMPDSNPVVAVEAQPARKAPGDVSVTMKNGAILIGFGRLASASTPVTVELVNLRGQTAVFKKIAHAEAGNGQVTLPKLRRGVYVLKIRGMGGTALLKKVTVF